MTYIGLKVQNVPFDGHITVRWLGEEELDEKRLDYLTTILHGWENLRFTTYHMELDWFGPNKDIPVVKVNSPLLLTLLDNYALFHHLDKHGFYNQGFPFNPHITLPKMNYPLPNSFIVGPLYIKNGKNPRIYLGA